MISTRVLREGETRSNDGTDEFYQDGIVNRTAQIVIEASDETASDYVNTALLIPRLSPIGKEAG